MNTTVRVVCVAIMLLAAKAQAQDVVVVVNAANPVSAMSAQDVANMMLKRVTKWGDGKTVEPVDQERTAKARDIFSRRILKRSVASIASYWQTQIFSGKNVPPHTRPSDTDVLAFVRGSPNAIGYVSANVPLGANVKAIRVN